MDEAEAIDVPTVGDQLRAAREAKKLSLEDIAASTRIPRRHLESLESGDWSKLPAPTYSVGFAKSYAGAVGLDRAAIGEQLRAEMGGVRADTASPEVFQPADPARTMPKWLVLAAIAAVIVIALGFSWWQNRSLNEPDEVAVAEAPAPAAQAPAAARPQPTGQRARRPDRHRTVVDPGYRRRQDPVPGRADARAALPGAGDGDCADASGGQAGSAQDHRRRRRRAAGRTAGPGRRQRQPARA